MNTLATIGAIASSAFIFVPAGRDIVSYETFLLPGEENVRPLMMMADEKARPWFWGMWGFNHILISSLKILAVKEGNKSMLKLLALSAIVTAYYCVLGQQAHGDMEGFIAICVVQILSLGYLGFAADTAEKGTKEH